MTASSARSPRKRAQASPGAVPLLRDRKTAPTARPTTTVDERRAFARGVGRVGSLRDHGHELRAESHERTRDRALGGGLNDRGPLVAPFPHGLIDRNLREERRL